MFGLCADPHEDYRTHPVEIPGSKDSRSVIVRPYNSGGGRSNGAMAHRILEPLGMRHYFRRPGCMWQGVPRSAYGFILADIGWEELLPSKVAELNQIAVVYINMTNPFSQKVVQYGTSDASASKHLDTSIPEILLIVSRQFLLACSCRLLVIFRILRMKPFRPESNRS
jgi:hypothetical protein